MNAYISRRDWERHIEEALGMSLPRHGGDPVLWIEAIDKHRAGCPICDARVRTQRRNIRAAAARAAREDCYRSLGMTKGKTALGRTIWE
jgi:hypothetical protein